MNFEPIQDSIVAQLASRFAGSGQPFTALRLPDAEGDYRRAVTGMMAYVVNVGSSSPGVRNTNPVTQDRIARFVVECYCRRLYGESGINAGRHLVERALVGFKPLNCDRLYFVKDEIDKGDDNIWTYVINFECKTILVQDGLSEESGPNLSQVAVKFKNDGDDSDDNNGQETIVIPS